MPSYGSSSIPNNLTFAGVNYVTGPTGATGAIGPTGSSIIGPTGNPGPIFNRALISGSTMYINYGGTTYSFGVSGPVGSSQRVDTVSLNVNEIGSNDAYSLFYGYDEDDLYKLYFRTIRVVGEATGGISGDAFYISSPGTTNAAVGKTGSLFYINTGTGGFGQKIDATNDETTNYYRSLITPNASSKLGITLDTFTFKINQHHDSVFTGITQLSYPTDGNLNWLTTSDASGQAVMLGFPISTFTPRTDLSLFSTFYNSANKSIQSRLTFQAEGITLGLISKQYDPITVSQLNDSIVYGTQTYKSSIIGSCCYCSVNPEQGSNILHKSCIDYASKEFCDSINGNFNFKSCNDRYLGEDCYSGGACCVNGICLETNKELCSKIYGSFYPNVRCNELEDGCPTGCVLSASCCIDGTCYSLPSENASEDLCGELGGKYDATKPCSERNCCVEGFIGACCVGSDECYDDTAPNECKSRGGVYQGPGTICASSSCCKDTQNTVRSLSFTQSTTDVAYSLKVGDYFAGGIVAGFVGYPPPPGLGSDDSYFANGEVISEIENYSLSTTKNYIAVNGVYNPTLRCNCSNFSPSRYVDTSSISRSNGKVLAADAKSLSGVKDNYNLTFYNRLSDACLFDENKACNDNGYKQYGYNSILAYKLLTKQIYETDVPSAWVLIVSPTDFSDGNVSFGMSMSVNGFAEPDGYQNYSNQLWQNNISTPYGTTVFDGLLNTRLFDSSSIERNTWFITNNYTVNRKIETLDPLAYYRFIHPRYNYWQSEIDEERISRDASYFKEKYKEMWYAINTKNTALYQISQKNADAYNGYSDWYIPSALELNIINYNIDEINTGIINQTSGEWRTISKTNYWSSTTGGRLIEINSQIAGVKAYESQDYALEASIQTTDPLINTWRNYKVAQAHRAYTQDMSSGKMISSLKSSSSAKLRGCRMVPIYFKNKDLKDQYEFSFKYLNTCQSCR